MPSTGARMTVRSRSSRACATAARAASTSGLVSTVPSPISAWLVLAAADGGLALGRGLGQRRLRRLQIGRRRVVGVAGRGQLLVGDGARLGQVLAAAEVDAGALEIGCAPRRSARWPAPRRPPRALTCALARRHWRRRLRTRRSAAASSASARASAMRASVSSSRTSTSPRRTCCASCTSTSRDRAADQRGHLGDVGADIGVVGGDVAGVQGLVALIAAAGEQRGRPRSR